jgi:diguanylate cyclase (GGDEF)-like protein
MENTVALTALESQHTGPHALPDARAASADANQPEAFRALLQGIGVIAGLTHVAFCSLFFWAGVTNLAWVNVFSVLSYVAVFVLARRGQIDKAWALTIFEVLGHAIVAVAMIGWDTGFHYYILLVIPVAVISSIRPVSLKGATVLGVMFTYLGLDIAFRHTGPARELSMAVIDGLHYFNVVGVMIILIFLAGYYYLLINRATHSLRELASVDPLTQLLNRRAINEVIRHQAASRAATGSNLSFVLCDLDHFKAINDTRGHDAGDQVLRAVSAALRLELRDSDAIARWGGEEFLVVLPGTDVHHAKRLAERLRQRVADLVIPAEGPGFGVTLTLGVANLLPGETSEQAIARADTALYDGKRSGRNRVVCAPS